MRRWFRPLLLLTIVGLFFLTGCNPTDRFVRELGSADPAKRIRAAMWLQQNPTPKALPALRQGLAADDFAVRSAFALAIARIGDREAAKDAAERISDDVLDDEPEAARRALDTLAAMGGPALGELMTLATVVTQQPLQSQILDRLVGAIDKADAEDRREAVNILLSALEETDPTLYRLANGVLEVVAPKLAPELAAEGLVHSSRVVRRSVIIALGNLGDPSATSSLIDMLGDPNVTVRMDAAQALGKIGDPAALKPLRKLLKEDADLRVRKAVRDAIASIEAR